MELFISISMFLVGLILGALLIYLLYISKSKLAQKEIDQRLEEVDKEAKKMKNTLIFEAKEEAHNIKVEAQKELKERKDEVKEAEKKLEKREASIDKRDELLTRREENITAQENEILDKNEEIRKKQDEVDKLKEEELEKLSKIAKYPVDKAKAELMKLVEASMKEEVAIYIKDEEEKARLEASNNAKELIVTAMQRYAQSVTEEATVTTIKLPDDDIKGRIIGREGRNIRTIESITGVDLIIDDTPEVIVLSSFDPYRREIARITLEKLIKDGRIHPARIEEVYDKVVKEKEEQLVKYGKEALFELGIQKMNTALIKLLGKMKFRFSYGQNALSHSVEVAHLAGLIAGELGENVQKAKRAGLLHDIGKAVDHDLEGSHIELGLELAKKYGEPEVVINSIASHHGEVEASSITSVIVAIADSLSAARPGARNDSLENYIKRITELENIAKDEEGVEKAYAVQAGREIRVMVTPDKINDKTAAAVARNIRKKIEDNLQYPGTIKVTVIRELRVEEEAK